MVTIICGTCNGDVAYGRLFGGNGGGRFDDGLKSYSNEYIVRVCIRSASRVDQIEFVTNRRTLKHGGNGGSSHCWDSPADIVSYYVCWGKKNGSTRVFHIEFTTADGNKFGGGKKTNSCGRYNIPSGANVFGMVGKSASEVDEIGFAFSI